MADLGVPIEVDPVDVLISPAAPLGIVGNRSNRSDGGPGVGGERDTVTVGIVLVRDIRIELEIKRCVRAIEKLPGVGDVQQHVRTVADLLSLDLQSDISRFARRPAQISPLAGVVDTPNRLAIVYVCIETLPV